MVNEWIEKKSEAIADAIRAVVECGQSIRSTAATFGISRSLLHRRLKKNKAYLSRKHVKASRSKQRSSRPTKKNSKTCTPSENVECTSEIDIKEEPLCYDDADLLNSASLESFLAETSSSCHVSNEHGESHVIDPTEDSHPTSPPTETWGKREESPLVSRPEDDEDFYLASSPEIKKEVEDEEDVVFNNTNVVLPWEWYSPERGPPESIEEVSGGEPESIAASVRGAECPSHFAEPTVNRDVIHHPGKKKTRLYCTKCRRTFYSADKLYRHLLKDHRLLYACSICFGVKETESQLERHFRRSHPTVCFVCRASFETCQETVAHRLCEHTKYMCRECDATFGLRAELFAHEKRCRLGLRCGVCKCSFETRGELCYHNAVEHLKFACKFCDTRTSSKGKLKAHVKKQHGAYKCQVCEKSFGERGTRDVCDCKDAVNPYSVPNFRYVCNICSTMINSLEDLKKHNMIHHHTHCPNCNQDYETLKSLGRHICKMVALTKIVECRTCGACFETTKGYVTHYAASHLKFKCSYCDIMLATELDCEIHEAGHTANTAEHNTMQQSCNNLQLRKSTCSDRDVPLSEVEMECPICMACFTTVVDYQTHYNVSHSEFKCSYCDTKLATKHDFEMHEATHTSDTAEHNIVQPCNDLQLRESTRRDCEIPLCENTSGDLETQMRGTTDSDLEVRVDKTCEIICCDKAPTCKFEATEVDIAFTTDEVDLDITLKNNATENVEMSMHETRGTYFELPVDKSDDLLSYKIPHNNFETPVHDTEGIDLEKADESTGSNFELVNETPAFDIPRRSGRIPASRYKTTVDDGETSATVETLEIERNFKLSETLESRVLAESNENQQCNVCNAILCSEEALELHHGKHHNWSCNVCRLVFDSMELFQAHNQSHVMRYYCSFCRIQLEKVWSVKGKVRAGQCGICRLQLEPESVFAMHEAKHFKCTSCSECFVTFKELSDHRWSEHLTWHCRICDHQTHSEANYNAHRTTHFKFRCKFCDSPHETAESLGKHVNTKHWTRSAKRRPPIVFEPTSKKIPTSVFLQHTSRPPTWDKVVKVKVHPSTRTEEYRCRICKIDSKSFEGLWEHQKTHRVINYCKVCNVELETERELDDHKRKHSAIVCQSCGEAFETRVALGNHRWNVHLKWRCQLCGVESKTAASHKRHAQRHAPVSFKCAKCGKSFATSKERNTHKLEEHFGYECRVCGSRFKYGRDFKEHKNTHEDPVTCAICTRTFDTKSIYREHIIQEHF